MDERKRTEEWADQYLARHRSATHRDDHDEVEAAREWADRPGLMKVLNRFSREDPDPQKLVLAHRSAKRHARAVKYEAIVTIIAAVLACLAVAAWLGMF